MRARPAVLGTLALLVASLLSYAPIRSAEADFAADCAAPTRTLSGGSNQPISVAVGETLLLTGGSFTGGVNEFPSGAQLCVSGTATLAPAYLNNAAGALDVAPDGTATFPQIAVATGFDLENQGTVTFAGLNVNGAASIHNLAGGTMTVSGQFSPSAGGIVNDGVFNATGGLNVNTQASFTNTKTLNLGTSTVNGQFDNTGITAVSGSFTVNGSAIFRNRCALTTTQNFSNSSSQGDGSTNDGLLDVAGLFSNNGTWLQSQTGTTTSGSLSNDGRVGGFGRYEISGDSRTQNIFAGSTPRDPIVVDDATPPAPPQIFNTQSGTVVNVVAGNVRAEPASTYPAPGCTDAPRADADVATSKTAPRLVLAGGTLTFTITVTNNGNDAAEDVVVTDALPPTLTAVTASDGGVVSGGTVTWQLGTLAAGSTRELTVTGTAPASGTLQNQVSSTSTTPDPDPVNNDGTAAAANTTTDVVGAQPPPNEPPVADDVTVTTQTDTPTLGRVTASDPDDGQTLTFTGPTTGPSHGGVLLAASGVFAYRPDAGFAGRDTFTYEVCDNGEPVLCDTGTVTVDVYPVAIDDQATTFEGTAVSIPVAANDLPGGVVTAVATPPANGTATVLPGGEIEYTPVDGFTGTDTFTYLYCSPDAAALCVTAEVTVEVSAANTPPLINSPTVTTTTDQAVSGALEVSDPEDDTVTVRRGYPPRSGTAVVNADGTYTYTPRTGFSGTDSFQVIACDDGDPQLCSTGLVTVQVYPVAVDDTASTTEGRSVSIPVLGNDLGALNEPPVVVTQPGSGRVRVVGKRIVYTPDAGFTGTDTFTYQVCSPGPDPLCSEPATVTVDVSAAEPQPTPTPSPGSPDGSAAGPASTDVTSAPSGDSYGLADTGGPALAVLVGGGLLVLLGALLLSLQRRRR